MAYIEAQDLYLSHRESCELAATKKPDCLMYFVQIDFQSSALTCWIHVHRQDSSKVEFKELIMSVFKTMD